MTKAPKTNRERKKLAPNVVWLGIVSMFNDMSGEIVARALPIFLTSALGVGYGMIGLIEGIADTTSSLLKLYVGRLSDRTGSRKWLAFSGYALTTIARPILFFANSWVIPLISRFIDRAGKGIRTSPRDALIADSVEPEDRGRAFGINRALDPLGAVLGALIGAAAVAWFAPTGQAASSGISTHVFKVLVAIATVPTVLSCVILWIFIKEPAKKAGAKKAMGSIWAVGKDKRFGRLLIVLVLFTLGSSSDAFLVLRATASGVSVVQVFILIACFNLVTTLSAYPAGILSDRISRRSMIRLGWLFYAVIYAGFAFATSSTLIWVLFISYGLFYGLTEGVQKAFVADLVPKEKVGTAFGLYNAATGIALLPASLIAGFLWQNVSIAAPFIFGAAVALLATILLVLLVPEAKPVES